MDDLPTLIDAERCEELLPRETEICEKAGSLLQQAGRTAPACLNQCLNALVLANELLWAHESESPADETLHLCAEQLKCWFLDKLDKITTAP